MFGFVMRAVAFALASQMLAPGVASAQDRPRTSPSRDVTVVYALGGAAQQGAMWMTMFYAAAQRTLRLDFHATAAAARPSGSLLVEGNGRRAVMLAHDQRAFWELPEGNTPQMLLLLDDTTPVAPLGWREIAGHRCRDWRLTGDDSGGVACVTEDGVVLRATRDRPEGAMIQAVSMTFEPIPPGRFQPPAGYTRMVRVPRPPAEGAASTRPSSGR